MQIFLLFATAAVLVNGAPEVNAPAAAPVANGQEHLISFEGCKEDIHRLCKKDGIDLNSDMSILECLQDAGQSETETLTRSCEELVWQFKVRITQDERFFDAAKQYCKAEMDKMPEMNNCLSLPEKGYPLSCMIDYVQNLTKTSDCHSFLSRTERLAFSDFRLIGPFVDKCKNAIEKFGCGALTPNKAHEKVRVPHTQGMALECLIQEVVKRSKEADPLMLLGNECRHEVLRLSEMQADDWHLDRPLFFACRSDREKFCKGVPSGQGKVFECLLLKRGDKEMKPECSTILSERAFMLGQNYRLAHPLTKACEKEMKDYKCEPQSQLEAAAHFHLSWILLCLESGANGVKESHPNEKCAYEMRQHRTMMMSEFKMAPELVMNCAQEIDKWCSPRGDIEAEGRTLHCLMGHAQARDEKEKLGPQCLQAVTTVVKVADIGKDYKVDKILYASCRSLIDGACSRDVVSESATLQCLMKHIDNPDMNAVCEKRLLEVQYFMARDWSLDPQLYTACHEEAMSRCHALDNWHQSSNSVNLPDPGPQVLACLYRSAYDEQNPLPYKCGIEVRRVLHSRAVRVNLIPEVEDYCRDALSEYCSHNVQPMEEMQCLQDHFEKPEFIKKHKKCQEVIVEFTKMESKDTKINQALTRSCKPVIMAHCQQYANEEIDHGDVMECLLNNKDTDEMSSKCRSYVNHFELVSLRDYHFSFRFQKACTPDIQKHCSGRNNDKGEIIRCLSEVRFEHKVLGQGEDLSQECKKQLKTAYLQQEQVEFDDKEHMADADPTLHKKCARELQQFSCNNKNTFEETVACLREKFEQLGPECKSMIFYREKIEAVDNTMDDELQRKCKYDINKFCSGHKEENILECLANPKIVRLFQRECKAVVQERMQEAARDVRLRPGLLNACKDEIQTYCQEDLQKINRPEYAQMVLEGVVVGCLREKYRKSAHEQIHLRAECKTEITKAILEAEFDPKLDPALYKACQNTISKHCSSSVIQDGGHLDNIVECLKADFYKGTINDQACAKEISRLSEEELVDIHLDTSLFEACSEDVQRLCRDITPGNSRVIMCLMDAADNSNAQLRPSCRNKLAERNKLWQKAHSEYKMELPDNWNDAVNLVLNHPKGMSYIGYFSGFVFFLLLAGCCLGRCTKRTHYELKNR